MGKYCARLNEDSELSRYYGGLFKSQLRRLRRSRQTPSEDTARDLAPVVLVSVNLRQSAAHFWDLPPSSVILFCEVQRNCNSNKSESEY